MKRQLDHGPPLLSEHTHLLLYIHAHPEATVRELADALDASERQTFRWLSELQKAGYLTRMKNGRRNHYVVNPETRVDEGTTPIPLSEFLDVLAHSV